MVKADCEEKNQEEYRIRVTYFSGECVTIVTNREGLLEAFVVAKEVRILF